MRNLLSVDRKRCGRMRMYRIAKDIFAAEIPKLKVAERAAVYLYLVSEQVSFSWDHWLTRKNASYSSSLTVVRRLPIALF